MPLRSIGSRSRFMVNSILLQIAPARGLGPVHVLGATPEVSHGQYPGC
jgi:hypothetical protein